MINKLTKEYLLNKRERFDLCLRGNLENVGIIYRKRADVNINLYLTEYALNNTESDYYKNAFKDYQKAIELLTQANSGTHLSETLLAYGNAIKEQFLPVHRRKEDFAQYEKNAKKEYQKCFDLTLNIDYLRYHFFTMLEQMNLEIRKKVWNTDNISPKRLIIFHSLKSPLSHQYLKGVYYFAYKHLVEVWEYNYGRVPDSDIDEHFIGDRLCDSSGIVFLCSPNYKKTEKIIEYEVEEVKKLKNNRDPIKVFALDIGNPTLINELKVELDIKLSVAKEKEFEIKIQEFLEGLENIYDCRKSRCKTIDT